MFDRGFVLKEFHCSALPFFYGNHPAFICLFSPYYDIDLISSCVLLKGFKIQFFYLPIRFAVFQSSY